MPNETVRKLIEEHGWQPVLMALADAASAVRAERSDDRGREFGRICEGLRDFAVSLDLLARANARRGRS